MHTFRLVTVTSDSICRGNIKLCTFQSLCINEEVLRLGSIQRINDRCIEMQKNKHGESLSHTTSELLMLNIYSRVKLLKYLISHFSEKQRHEEGVKRKRGPAKSVCPYYKASALQQMRDEILGTVQDIEQLLKLGRETHSCPYYSTRLAIPPAQVILSPSVPPVLCHITFGGCCAVSLLCFFYISEGWPEEQ